MRHRPQHYAIRRACLFQHSGRKGGAARRQGVEADGGVRKHQPQPETGICGAQHGFGGGAYLRADAIPRQDQQGGHF